MLNKHKVNKATYMHVLQKLDLQGYNHTGALCDREDLLTQVKKTSTPPIHSSIVALVRTTNDFDSLPRGFFPCMSYKQRSYIKI